MFTQYPFITSVSAHAAPGTQLIQLEAEDHDEGPNGEVLYRYYLLFQITNCDNIILVYEMCYKYGFFWNVLHLTPRHFNLNILISPFFVICFFILWY